MKTQHKVRQKSRTAVKKNEGKTKHNYLLREKEKEKAMIKQRKLMKNKDRQ